jgi:hypothetical protein
MELDDLIHAAASHPIELLAVGIMLVLLLMYKFTQPD